MADFTIVNQDVKQVADKIQNTIASDLKTAGEKFCNDFDAAIKEMQGEAKDELVKFFDEVYRSFVSDPEKGVPGMVKSLGELLEVNRTQFVSTDSQIAETIRKSH